MSSIFGTFPTTSFYMKLISEYLHAFEAYNLAIKLISPIWAKSKAKKAIRGERSIIPIGGMSLRNIRSTGSVA